MCASYAANLTTTICTVKDWLQTCRCYPRTKQVRHASLFGNKNKKNLSPKIYTTTKKTKCSLCQRARRKPARHSQMVHPTEVAYGFAIYVYAVHTLISLDQHDTSTSAHERPTFVDAFTSLPRLCLTARRRPRQRHRMRSVKQCEEF